jgi:hypothetical protein
MKKGIAILLITVLVIDLTSCTSYKQLSTRQDFEFYQNNDHIQVLEIRSKKDSIIVFNEKFPGKLENKQVYGIRQKQFPYNAADSIIFTAQDQNAAYIRNNRVHYKIISHDKSGFTCISSDTIRMSFSDITQMNVKKIDPLKTTLLIVGLSALIIGKSVYLLSTDLTINGGLGGI